MSDQLSRITRPVDLIGRQVPHRISFAAILRTLPWMLREFKDVPARYVTDADDGMSVACPCGERPVVELGYVAVCSCDRSFFNAGRRMMVAGSPDS